MPNRYKNTKIQNVKGKKILKTTILPNIGADIADVIIISRYGERLDLLSNEHYGTPSYWWIIAEANSLEVLSFDMQIRIPKRLDKIQEKMDKISEGR